MVACSTLRFVCQAAVQPGLVRIWTGLLQYGEHACGFRVVPLPQDLAVGLWVCQLLPHLCLSAHCRRWC